MHVLLNHSSNFIKQYLYYFWIFLTDWNKTGFFLFKTKYAYCTRVAELGMMQRLKFVWTKTNAWGNFIATNLRTKFCSLRGPLSSTVFLIAQLQSKHTWSAVPKCSERKVRNVKWVFFCNYLFCLFVLKTALINSSFHWFYCKLIKAFFFFFCKKANS